MPTTDTFIIPPMQQVEEPKKEKEEKKKSKTSKTLLLVGLILLIISLPIAIYYITKQQQDIRSRAAGGTCKNITPNPTGSNCFEVNCHTLTSAVSCSNKTDDLDKKCCTWYPAAIPTPTYRPSNTPTKKPGGGGGNPTNTPTKQPTKEPTKKPTKKPTVEPTVSPTTEPTNEPTTEPTNEPTTEPTNEPTTVPQASRCDASCNSDNDCISGLTCSSINGINRCRNASCPAESSCSCVGPTNVPEDNSGETAGQEMPVSGVGPGIIGSITAIGSIILLIVGLAL